MTDSDMPQTENQLLKELQETDDPVELLSNLFDEATYQDDLKLRRFLRILMNQGQIHIPLWADNKPYSVEMLYPTDGYVMNRHENDHPVVTINDSHDIVIGNGARVSRSFIGAAQKAKGSIGQEESKSFYQKHPVLCSLLISFIVGFLFLFSFWGKIVAAIEGIF